MYDFLYHRLFPPVSTVCCCCYYCWMTICYHFVCRLQKKRVVALSFFCYYSFFNAINVHLENKNPQKERIGNCKSNKHVHTQWLLYGKKRSKCIFCCISGHTLANRMWLLELLLSLFFLFCFRKKRYFINKLCTGDKQGFYLLF